VVCASGDNTFSAAGPALRLRATLTIVRVEWHDRLCRAGTLSGKGNRALLEPRRGRAWALMSPAAPAV
jgi:hypothetical protein